MNPILALVLASLVAPLAPALQPRSLSPQEALEALASEFLRFHHYYRPAKATALGLSGYQGKLPDLSRDGLIGLGGAYQGWLERVSAIDQTQLSPDARLDLTLLLRSIEAELLEIRSIRRWERDPSYYLDLVVQALAPFAAGDRPAEERAVAVMDQERQIPNLLAQARTNLQSPARVFTLVAMERMSEIVALVGTELPASMPGLAGQSSALLDRSTERTLAELRSFRAFLEEDLLGRSEGRFRVGSEVLTRWLRSREHISTPLDQLMATTDSEIERLTRWMDGEARRADPSRSVAEQLAAAQGDPVTGAGASAAVARMLRLARAFVLRNELVGLFGDETLSVRSAPPALGTLEPSLLTWGLLRTSGPEVYLRVAAPASAPVGPGVDGSYTSWGLAGTAVVLGFPGEFVYLQSLGRNPSVLRRTFSTPSTESGWGLYMDEVMTGRGFGGEDPNARLTQLQRALLALVETRVAILMHTRGMSLVDAAAELRGTAYVSERAADRITQRIAANPLSAFASVGARQIARLKADVQRRSAVDGDQYSDRAFHDAFLAAGAPVALARELFLP